MEEFHGNSLCGKNGNKAQGTLGKAENQPSQRKAEERQGENLEPHEAYFPARRFRLGMKLAHILCLCLTVESIILINWEPCTAYWITFVCACALYLVTQHVLIKDVIYTL